MPWLIRKKLIIISNGTILMYLIQAGRKCKGAKIFHFPNEIKLFGENNAPSRLFFERHR